MDLNNVTNIVVLIFMITFGMPKLDNVKEKTLSLQTITKWTMLILDITSPSTNDLHFLVLSIICFHDKVRSCPLWGRQVSELGH